MKIRNMQAADIPAGLQLCRLARWNQVEEDWRSFLDSPDGGGRLAESDGTVAGTVTFLRYGRCFSWLSMMLVHPDVRRAGTGTRLMEAALDALAGEPCVRLDATPLGEPLYRRFGFRDEYELARAKVRVAEAAEPAAENVRRMQPAELPEVFAMDRQVFGADRGALMSGFYRRAPEMAWTVRRGGVLQGYCFGRPGYLYRQLGPLVAGDDDCARDLVGSCLTGLAGEDVALDAPLSDAGWIAWLRSAGFAVERPFLRMCRGENPCPGQPARQYAIGGPEFG